MGILHVIVVQPVGVVPEWPLDLRDDFVAASFDGEPVDLRFTEQGRQGAAQILHRHAHLRSLGAIDIHHHFGLVERQVEVDESELKKPRGYQIGELTAIAIVLGVVSTLFDFAFFGYFMQYEKEVLQTMWFVGSVLTELVLLFSIRTALPFWRAKRPSTTVLALSSLVLVLTIALPFIPTAHRLFGFIAPNTEHLTALFFLVLFYFASSEGMKLLFYRFWHNKERHALRALPAE